MLVLLYGDSMKPILRAGWNLVSVKELKTKEEIAQLNIGDIIYYKSIGLDKSGNETGHKENVLHRIIRKEGDVFLLNGDNRTYAEFVNSEDIIGIMEKVIL